MESSFKDCERHPNKISMACINGKGYVSVASFDRVCRRYISHLVDEQTEVLKNDR